MGRLLADKRNCSNTSRFEAQPQQWIGAPLIIDGRASELNEPQPRVKSYSLRILLVDCCRDDRMQGKRMIAVLTVPSPLVRAPAEQRTQLLSQVRASARAIEDGLRAARR